MNRSSLALVLCLSVVVCIISAHEPPDTAKQAVSASPATQDARLASTRIRLSEGMKAELYAAEPLLANPVAFCFDNQGNIYVAETYRIHEGVTDNRSHMYWLDDDLACNTVADRDAKYRKHLKEQYKTYEKERDQVRKLIDSKGLGRPDQAFVFSDNYRRTLDGIGSGVLAYQGNVYFTCIPDLWLLKDTTGKHHADVQKSLSTGFGVHTSFIGHDLHGLAVSPVDGKLYFSIGDRGANIITKEGNKIEVPHCGAVFRCNVDGSDLELFAKGLRNPQELAFDDSGNLFTGDNNSDSGDRARFVYLPEGADCGWHIGWQYMEQPYSRGPWNAEYMWHPPRADQPAYIVPPITNLGDGPSGLVYYPGTGLPDRYKNHFFLADFRGSPNSSGIRSFTVQPKGAGFELADSHQFAWGVLATDVDFGPDGAMYLLDWVEGWGKTGKGRIHRVFDVKHQGSTLAQQVKTLLASDWSKKPIDELAKLLSHGDRRVRLEAQTALVNHTDHRLVVTKCCQLLAHPDNVVAARHAIWTVGQIHRRTSADSDQIAKSLRSVLQSDQADLILQALRISTCEQPVLQLSSEEACKLLEHNDATIRAQAAQCIGKQGILNAYPVLIKLINTIDNDPWLRHAAIQGLVGLYSKKPELFHTEWQNNPSQAVQLAMVVAARRLRNEAFLEQMLQSNVPVVMTEAIRAIHDEPGLTAAKRALLKLQITKEMTEQTQLRLLNIHLGNGDATDAQTISSFARNPAMPEKVRVEAVKMLGVWAQPPGRDWVVGLWRPISARSDAMARKVLLPVFPELLNGSPKVLTAAIKAADKLQLKSLATDILKLAEQTSRPTAVRITAMQTATSLAAPGLDQVTAQLLRDKHPELRKSAQSTLTKLHPHQAVTVLTNVLQQGEVHEQQSAISLLAGMKSSEADAVLDTWVNRLAQGKVRGELQLELIEAINLRNKDGWKDKLNEAMTILKKQGPYPEHRTALAGGDPQAGRKVFFEKTAAACLRCHRIGKDGGEVGPELTTIGKEKNREYLLEAIVDPNKSIAKGFELSIILTKDGVVQQGVVKKEDADTVTIMTPEAKTVVLKKTEIEERKTGKSAMPEDAIKHLSLRELRDVIEYLANQK